MPGKVIAVANRKGGVGKTTLSILLAQGFQISGDPVVLVDVDPQSSASIALAGEDFHAKLFPIYLESTLKTPERFGAKKPAKDFLWGQISPLTDRPDITLALVPCSPDLWSLEDDIADRSSFFDDRRRAYQDNFEKLLKRLKRDFKFVVIDTAPGRSAFGRFALKSADIILAPCEPTPMSLRAMKILVKEINEIKKNGRAFLVWTKYKDLASLVQMKKGLGIADTKTIDALLPNLLQILDKDADATDAGLRQSGRIGKSFATPEARTFDSLYGSEIGKDIFGIRNAILKRLGLE